MEMTDWKFISNSSQNKNEMIACGCKGVNTDLQLYTNISLDTEHQ